MFNLNIVMNLTVKGAKDRVKPLLGFISDRFKWNNKSWFSWFCEIKTPFLRVQTFIFLIWINNYGISLYQKILFIFKNFDFWTLTARENDFKWLIQENIFIIMWCQPCIIKERQEILNRTSPFSRTPSISWVMWIFTQALTIFRQ